jgi:hypothetical protein
VSFDSRGQFDACGNVLLAHRARGRRVRQECLDEQGGEPSRGAFGAPAAAGHQGAQGVRRRHAEGDVGDVVGGQSSAQHAVGGERAEETQRPFSASVFHLVEECCDIGVGGGCRAQHVDQGSDAGGDVDDL